jgi:hypothetical protein
MQFAADGLLNGGTTKSIFENGIGVEVMHIVLNELRLARFCALRSGSDQSPFARQVVTVETPFCVALRCVAWHDSQSLG